MSRSKSKCLKEFGKGFSEYSEESTIHSMGYIGKMHLHWFERTFWILVFLASFASCAILIRKTFNKWQTDPIIVSFNERSTPTWEIPFPAVTICPESKINSKILNVADLLERINANGTITDEEKLYIEPLSQLCNFDINLNHSHLSDEAFIKALRNISQNYNARSSVEWKGKFTNFSNHFNEVLTEDGICQTFNMLDQKDLYRKVMAPSLKLPYHHKRSNWTMFGYDTLKVETYPHRILGAGYKAGLLMLIATRKSDINYSCKSPIDGYRMSLHTPGDFPRPSTQFYSIPLNALTLVSVKLRVMSTANALESYPPKDRQCFFPGEKRLQFFKLYTQSNCELECLARYVSEKCGCVKFSMPRDNITKVCSHSDKQCIEDSELNWIINELEVAVHEEAHAVYIRNSEDSDDDEIENYELERLYEDREDNFFKSCECLPSCQSIHYDAEISLNNMNIEEYMKAKGTFDSMDNDYTFAAAKIYFRDSQFIKSKRSELYGLTQFLASCGGFLGLLMGGSVLSIVEIFYHLTLKSFFKKAKRNQSKNKIRDLKDSGEKISENKIAH